MKPIRKRQKVFTDKEREAIMTEIAKNLNRTKTARELAQEYNISVTSIWSMSRRLRKSPYNLDIPTQTTLGDFHTIAERIVKNNPGLVKK